MIFYSYYCLFAVPTRKIKSNKSKKKLLYLKKNMLLGILGNLTPYSLSEIYQNMNMHIELFSYNIVVLLYYVWNHTQI